MIDDFPLATTRFAMLPRTVQRKRENCKQYFGTGRNARRFNALTTTTRAPMVHNSPSSVLAPTFICPHIAHGHSPLQFSC